MTDVRTLKDIFDRGTARPREDHVRWRDASGAWQSWSTAQYRCVVEDLASALRARGLLKGDRVALLSRNSPRWAATDFALVGSGLVTTPLYPTLPPDQVRFIVDDSGARGLFVEDEAQLARLAGGLEGSALEWIVVMTDEAVDHPLAQGFSSFVAEGQGGLGLGSGVSPGDLASIIYTSGTTGRPKGVMLSHENLVVNALACDEAIDLSGVEHRDLSLLPLSHIFQRLVDYLLFLQGATVAYCPDPHEAAQYLGEFRPTFFAAVPRLYEKIHQGMTKKIGQGPAWKRALAAWSLRVGRRRFHAWYRDGACDGSVGPLLAAQHAIADALVLRKLRGVFGGSVDICFSGGGPLTKDLHEFFRAIDLPLVPGYGLTETSPVLTTNRRKRMKLGSVGPALPGVELVVAADGELLARGPNVMLGYWNRPDETAATIVDGWLHTGDLARIDERGYVFITGRKKELLVLTTGKKVVPATVEERAQKCPLVAQSVLVGDERKFVALLVWPDVERLRAALEGAGQPSDAPVEALVALPAARKLVASCVAEACADLADFEQPKTVALLPRELSQADDELTPTLKVKRRVVAANWKDLIESCYGSRTEA